MSTAVILIAVIVFAVIYLLASQSKNKLANRQARKTPKEILPEIQQRLQSGEDKIKLIKYARVETGLGLKDAKDLVEGNFEWNPSTSNEELLQNVQEMLQSGIGEVKATKYVREQTGLGLKEAKDYVDNAKKDGSM
ncbi:ribosomal protein L7/L12 [Oceanobacillus timonensis]|uniref:ribosomal protein L7/L12 n=1 Tax=Oceanobacillus timonensis TaxID=1926285 RepID=UPI001FE36B73|nr:ribosomal protein L7/L12 [Oceanobacillus timonensis]